jgi:hypothetical protein
VIGDEERPLNMFDPASADAGQRALFEGLQKRIREAAATALAAEAAEAAKARTS